jgi:hypothetical protein
MPTLHDDSTRLAVMLAALLDTPRGLTELREQVADLASAVRMLEAALPPMLVDAETAGKALGRSPSTIRSWASRGLIPSVRVGRSHRIDLTKLRGLDASEIARLARAARSR